jgi:hypothetical protein
MTDHADIDHTGLTGIASTSTKLDDFGTPDDNTDLNATTGHHGLLLKLSGTATEYLDGSGAWSTPAGGGGSGAFVGAKAYQAGTQSIPNTTPTAVTLTTELYDTDGFHEGVTNPSRFTVPSGKAGYYSLKGKLYWDGNATGARTLWFLVNATTVVRGSTANLENLSSNPQQMVTTADVQLDAGDYVELIAYQSSGGALNVGHATQADWQSTMSIAFHGT